MPPAPGRASRTSTSTPRPSPVLRSAVSSPAEISLVVARTHKSAWGYSCAKSMTLARSASSGRVVSPRYLFASIARTNPVQAYESASAPPWLPDFIRRKLMPVTSANASAMKTSKLPGPEAGSPRSWVKTASQVRYAPSRRVRTVANLPRRTCFPFPRLILVGTNPASLFER